MNLQYMPARISERFFFRAKTMVVCVDLVVGRDVGCCKIWTRWSQAASVMRRLGGLINLS